jgi:PAS domain S-box-containing protein
MRTKTGALTSAQGHAVKSGTAERRKEKEPFSSSEKKYRALFKSMLQGAFFQAADGRLIDVNPQALNIFGLTRREFLSRTSQSPTWKVIREDGSLVPSQEYPSLAVLKTGLPDTDRILGVFNNRTKAYVWVIINAIPLFLPGESTPYQVCVTLHDITGRKQAEEKLQFFKESVDGSFDAIGMATPEGVHYYQNRAFDDLFGDIGTNQPASVYVDKEVCRDVFKTITAGGLWSGEVEMYAKDGGVRSILLRAYANKDRSGRIIGLVGIHTDITRRKKDERALRQSEERYRMLVETATDAIMTVNAQGRIVSWNRGAEKIYGFKAKNIIGRNCRLLVPERFLQLHDELFETLVTKGQFVASDILHEGYALRKDGSEFPAEQTFNMGWVDNEPFFTSIVRDISERKAIEKRLYESEELFRLSFENSPIGISIFNKDGVLIQANMCCEQCFGRSRKELLQRGLPMFMHPEDRERCMKLLGADPERFRRLTVIENRYFAADGRTIYTKQYIQGVFDTAGNLSFTIVLTEDITAAKQLALMNGAVITKLKDVHTQLSEFCDMLPDEQKFLTVKSLGDYNLSPMESRIATMMFHGSSNKIIARNLRISENTVKHHITSIYNKFNVNNRLEFSSAIRANRIII